MPARRPTKRLDAAPKKAMLTPHTTRPDDATWDKAALAAALDPVITIDAFGIIHSASNSVHRVLGWTPAELQGKNVSTLMPEPHRSGHDGYLANYHRTGQTNILNRPRRFDAQRKDGSLVPIELCVSRAELPGNAAPMFVGIIRDMRDAADAERSREQERVQYQQLLADQTTALQSAHLRLRMADRMASIGTLAAGLGHDMNNVLLPVRARLNALKAAAQAGRLSDAEGKHVEEIAKSVAYLQQLADGLHFLALDPEAKDNIRGGGATTDLKNWWSHVGSLLSKAVPKHVQVQASIPDNLPRVALPTHQLTQAILNLVVNAGEAIPPPSQRKRRQGVVRLRAQLVQDESAPRVRLAVTDNGSGMTPEVRQRAFEIFFTTKPRGLGTGLGLALVRTIVDQAGGKVDVESEVGKGTSVILEFPIAIIPTAARGTKRAAALSLNNGRAAAILRTMLESAGLEVAESSDARDPGTVDLWVVDPSVVKPNDARRWLEDSPLSRLVVFGTPDNPAWEAIESVTIADTRNFGSIRAALGRALAQLGGTAT